MIPLAIHGGTALRFLYAHGRFSEDLDFALEAGVDFIALSFVRTAEDIEQIKQLIASKGKDTPVVAKIEKPEALRNFKKILEATDAVMVARGDLGVEIEPEKVPIYQKKIILFCIFNFKFIFPLALKINSIYQIHYSIF